MKENLPENITQRAMECTQSNLEQVDTKKKRRFVYKEKGKQGDKKYAAQCDATAAIRKFKHKFPSLYEITLRPWLKKYWENLKEKNKAKNENVTLNLDKRVQPITPGY